MQSIIDIHSKPKPEVIAERQANLPLPEDPPTASDWNSADGTKVNVGSGGVSTDITYGKGSDGLREPATGESSVRVDGEALGVATAPDASVGRQGIEELDDIPKDATAR